MALGQHPAVANVFQALSRLLNRVGLANRWGQGRPPPVIHPDPWPLTNIPP